MLLIIIILAITVVAALIICSVQLSKHEFECQKCGHKTHFRWQKLVFAHGYDEYYIKCPKCGKKIMIRKQRSDKKSKKPE